METKEEDVCRAWHFLSSLFPHRSSVPPPPHHALVTREERSRRKEGSLLNPFIVILWEGAKFLFSLSQLLPSLWLHQRQWRRRRQPSF